jgi:hypothetical protein
MTANFGNESWQGGNLCAYTETASGERCGLKEIDGLEYCLHHVPDDLLDEAEEITGINRCRYDFGMPGACRQFAVKGAVPTRCKNHGANLGSRTHMEASRRNVESSAAERLAGIMAASGEYLMAPPAIGDPLIELLGLAAEIGALKEVLRAKVVPLLEGDKLRYAHSKAGEQLRQEIILYERALERFAKILIDISKLNIQDRLAGVQEQTAAMLERALDAALEESGVGLEGITGARKAFRRHLKVVQGELAS